MERPIEPVLVPATVAPAASAIPIAWLLIGAALSVSIVALMLGRHMLLVTAPPAIAIAGLAYTLVAAALLYRFREPANDRERMWRDGAESVSLFAGVALLGVIASYPVAASSTGFVDGSLERIDRVIGFDWLAWYRFAITHPWIQPFERAAYHSLFATPAIILVAFARAGAIADARRFIVSFWIAAWLTLLIFPFMPARGPLVTLFSGALPYVPVSGHFEAAVIVALRDRAFHTIDLSHLAGLVGAPSFHTASAVLFIAAAWPHCRLRWPVLILNVAMLLSIPVEGTHYLADMIMGGLVAGLALVLTAAIGWWAAQRAVRPRMVAEALRLLR